MSGLLANIL